jgi:hypothetical protein
MSATADRLRIALSASGRHTGDGAVTLLLPAAERRTVEVEGSGVLGKWGNGPS